MQTFPAYSDAREAAERIVRELANGSQAAALTATQSRDALAAFARLQGFYQSTGRRVSLLAAVSEFAEDFLAAPLAKSSRAICAPSPA